MSEPILAPGLLEPVNRLTRDLARAGQTLGREEARFLVHSYYSMQEDRKRNNSQLRALSESGEPHDILKWLADQSEILEKQIQRALDAYSAHDRLGQWARSIVGIGPVIAAGLLAHIDLEKAPTAGGLWRYAGLDPSRTWGKGEKRPWNADLKTLCWKIGESFVKNSTRRGSFYGPLYRERRAYEETRNEEGGNSEAAASELARLKGDFPEIRKVLEQGKLRPAHLHARAKRWTVKLFLSHYHEVGRKMAGLPVPDTYPVAFLGHAHKIDPPGAV